LNPIQIQFKTFGFKHKTLNQIQKLFLQAFIFNLRFWPSLSAHHPAHPAVGPTSRPRPAHHHLLSFLSSSSQAARHMPKRRRGIVVGHHRPHARMKLNRCATKPSLFSPH
jgi:hypothetical protein